MNDGLIDGFRHNAWATRVLLDTCADLTREQLEATAEGTYGSISATLWHIIRAEAGYCARLTGIEPAWDRKAETAPTIPELSVMNDELEQHWLLYLEEPFDAERIFVMPWVRNEVRDVPAGIVLIQALNHGTEHRSQVFTILTLLGIDPPPGNLWEFAEATDRARIHSNQSKTNMG